MIDDKKYILKDNAGIIFGITDFPTTLQNPDDDYEISNGSCIGMRIHMSDVDIDPVICMDIPQSKALVKALKLSIREYKRKERKERWKTKPGLK